MPWADRSPVSGPYRAVLSGGSFVSGNCRHPGHSARHGEVPHRTRHCSIAKRGPPAPQTEGGMTRREAQEILLACRPGREDLADPQVAAALELTRTDPALREWYEKHRAWDAAVRQGLGSIPVPADLKYAILTGERIVPGPAHWWQRRGVLVAAAAILVFLITLGVLFLNRGKSTNSFAQFRRSMIGTALREYRMDLQTNDMREIRTFLGRRG